MATKNSALSIAAARVLVARCALSERLRTQFYHTQHPDQEAIDLVVANVCRDYGVRESDLIE